MCVRICAATACPFGMMYHAKFPCLACVRISCGYSSLYVRVSCQVSLSYDVCVRICAATDSPLVMYRVKFPCLMCQDLRGYSFPTDVYSLGLTVCELGNAEQPYQGLPPTLMLVQKLKGLVPFLHDASNMDGETGISLERKASMTSFS